MKVRVSHYGEAVHMEHHQCVAQPDKFDIIQKGTISVSRRALSINEVSERFGHVWDYLNSFYIPAITREAVQFIASAGGNSLSSSYDTFELGE